MDVPGERLDDLCRDAIVNEVCRHTFGRLPQSANDERHWLEEAYRVAQHRGCQLSGWKLRMAIYYHYGRACGEW